MAVGINMSHLEIVRDVILKIIHASSRMSGIMLLLYTKERLQAHW